MNKTGKLILFAIVIFAIAMVVASMYWQGDSIYSGAYAPMVERSLQRKQAQEKENGGDSEQPQAPGFKEKDIDRQKGDGFSTY